MFCIVFFFCMVFFIIFSFYEFWNWYVGGFFDVYVKNFIIIIEELFVIIEDRYIKIDFRMSFRNIRDGCSFIYGKLGGKWI